MPFMDIRQLKKIEKSFVISGMLSTFAAYEDAKGVHPLSKVLLATLRCIQDCGNDERLTILSPLGIWTILGTG